MTVHLLQQRLRLVGTTDLHSRGKNSKIQISVKENEDNSFSSLFFLHISFHRTIDMLRPAKFPANTEVQSAFFIQTVFIQESGSETYFTAETPDAQAALPDSQKTAITIVTRKS